MFFLVWPKFHHIDGKGNFLVKFLASPVTICSLCGAFCGVFLPGFSIRFTLPLQKWGVGQAPFLPFSEKSNRVRSALFKTAIVDFHSVNTTRLKSNMLVL